MDTNLAANLGAQHGRSPSEVHSSEEPRDELGPARQASAPPPGTIPPVLSRVAYAPPQAAPENVRTQRTLISSELVIHGSVESRGGAEVVLMGTILGGLSAQGPVVIHPEASVQGPISAGSLVVAGRVVCAQDADVEVAGSLHLLAGAYLAARTIRYGTLHTETGARIRGVLEPHDHDELDAQAGRSQPEGLGGAPRVTASGSAVLGLSLDPAAHTG